MDANLGFCVTSADAINIPRGLTVLFRCPFCPYNAQIVCVFAILVSGESRRRERDSGQVDLAPFLTPSAPFATVTPIPRQRADM